MDYIQKAHDNTTTQLWGYALYTIQIEAKMAQFMRRK